MDYKQDYTQLEIEQAYNHMINTCNELAKKGWKQIELLDKDIETLLSKNKKKSRISKVKPKKIIKSCANCTNNVVFPPPHTCDHCDADSNPFNQNYFMWEPIFPVCKKG